MRHATVLRELYRKSVFIGNNRLFNKIISVIYVEQISLKVQLKRLQIYSVLSLPNRITSWYHDLRVFDSADEIGDHAGELILLHVDVTLCCSM